MIELVEIATTRAIRRRVSILVAYIKLATSYEQFWTANLLQKECLNSFSECIAIKSIFLYLTYILYHIFYKNQKRFFIWCKGGLYTGCPYIRPPLYDSVSRLTAKRHSVLLHQRHAVRIASLFKCWTLLILHPMKNKKTYTISDRIVWQPDWDSNPDLLLQRDNGFRDRRANHYTIGQYILLKFPMITISAFSFPITYLTNMRTNAFNSIFRNILLNNISCRIFNSRKTF